MVSRAYPSGIDKEVSSELSRLRESVGRSVRSEVDYPVEVTTKIFREDVAGRKGRVKKGAPLPTSPLVSADNFQSC